jgi:hypothetical protein
MNQPIIQTIVYDKKAFLALTALEKTQHPYALARTLTVCAMEAQAEVKRETAKNFRLRTEFIPKSIRIVPAWKKDIQQYGKAESKVYTTEKISFMTIHEVGGGRALQPPQGLLPGGGVDKGKSFSVPSTEQGGRHGDLMRNKTGSIRSRQRVGALLSHYKRIKTKTNRSIFRTPFVFRVKTTRTPIVARRLSEDRKSKLEFFYIFSKRLTYKQAWNYESTIKTYVNTNFSRIYRLELDKAVIKAKQRMGII